MNVYDKKHYQAIGDQNSTGTAKQIFQLVM